MLNSKENMAHAFGGAVIGVAVGMVMQKMFSPRCVLQPPKSADKNLKVCYEKVKKRSRSSDLRVPSNCHKNSGHRRSKSSSGSKRGKNECSSSASSNSQHEASAIKLPSSPSAKNEASQKCSSKSDGKSVYSSNMSTEYRAFVSKVPEKLLDINDVDFDRVSGHQPFETASTEYMPLMLKKTSKKNEKEILMFDINNRKPDSTMDYSHLKSKLLKKATDEIENTFYCDSERGPFGTMSTEYLPLELKKKSENAVPSIFAIEVNGRDSDFINSEIKDCSINATCGTEFYRESIETTSTEYLIRSELAHASDSEIPPVSEIISRESSTMFQEFNSVPINSNLETEIANSSREEHSAASTEELFKEFVTLPTFVNSDYISSTELNEFQSK